MEPSCPVCTVSLSQCVCKQVCQQVSLSATQNHNCSHTDIKVIILQDVAELKPSKQRLSSIPILSQVLANIEVVPCDADTYCARTNCLDGYSPSHIALLYPSDASISLTDINNSISSLATSNSDLSTPNDTLTYKDTNGTISGGEITDLKVLIVLDGSWITVQHILARNIFLHPKNCRHVRLPPNSIISESVYHSSGLRREPSSGYVSTAEAVAWALHFLSVDLQPCARTILKLFVNFVALKVGATHQIGHCVSESCSLEEDEMPGEVGNNKCGEHLFAALDPAITNSNVTIAADIDDNDNCVSNTTLLLLPSCGVRYKRPLTKTEKRKRVRGKEIKRRKRTKN